MSGDLALDRFVHAIAERLDAALEIATQRTILRANLIRGEYQGDCRDAGDQLRGYDAVVLGRGAHGAGAQSARPDELGQGRPQRALSVRLRQEIQALPWQVSVISSQ